MNNRTRLDSYARSRSVTYGKPLFIVESKKGVYLSLIETGYAQYHLYQVDGHNRKEYLIKRYKEVQVAMDALEIGLEKHNQRVVLNRLSQ